MGLVCWQDYCLDDKCSWSRASQWKLVVFFSPRFVSTKARPRRSHQRRSGASWEQLTQAVGEAPQLEQKRELVKNKQITATVSQGRWGNYKHCREFKGQLWGWDGRCLWFRVVAISLMEGTNEKKKKQQKRFGGSSDKANQSDYKRM